MKAGCFLTVVLLTLGLVAYATAAAAPILGKCGSRDQFSVGSCPLGKAGATCGMPGYACDSTAAHCCPTIDVSLEKNRLGPALAGLCPEGYTTVYGIEGDLDRNGYCVDFSAAPQAQR